MGLCTDGSWALSPAIFELVSSPGIEPCHLRAGSFPGSCAHAIVMPAASPGSCALSLVVRGIEWRIECRGFVPLVSFLELWEESRPQTPQ